MLVPRVAGRLPRSPTANGPHRPVAIHIRAHDPWTSRPNLRACMPSSPSAPVACDVAVRLADEGLVFLHLVPRGSVAKAGV